MQSVLHQTHLYDLAARCARSFARTLSLEKRGSRECRVRAAPAVSCAKCTEETHTSIQVQRKHSGIPRAMVLRLMPRSCVQKVWQNVRTGGSDQPPVAGSEPVRAQRP